MAPWAYIPFQDNQAEVLKGISTGAAWALCQVWLSGEPHTCPLLSQRIHFYEWACQLGILSPWGTRPGLGESESSRIIEENWLLSSPGFPNAQLLKHQTGGGGDVVKKANTTSCAVCVAPLSTQGTRRLAGQRMGDWVFSLCSQLVWLTLECGMWYDPVYSTAVQPV